MFVRPVAWTNTSTDRQLRSLVAGTLTRLHDRKPNGFCRMDSYIRSNANGGAMLTVSVVRLHDSCLAIITTKAQSSHFPQKRAIGK